MEFSDTTKLLPLRDSAQKLEFVFYSKRIGVIFSDSGVAERLEQADSGLKIELSKNSHTSLSVPKTSKTCQPLILSDEMLDLAAELQEKQLQDARSSATAVVAAPVISQPADISTPVASAAAVTQGVATPRIYHVIRFLKCVYIVIFRMFVPSRRLIHQPLESCKRL